MDNLERACGLHQRIAIIYVVDGYLATLTHESEDLAASQPSRIYPELQGKGDTILAALKDLDSKILGGNY